MSGWLIIVALAILAVVVLSWALSHVLWIALGVPIGWFIKEGVDWLHENVR